MAGQRERYEELLRWWKTGPGVADSRKKGVEHPAFRGLVGLGREAVRFVLEDLRDGVTLPPAAHDIIVRQAGTDPVPPAEADDPARVRDFLVAWGVEQRRIAAERPERKAP